MSKIHFWTLATILSLVENARCDGEFPNDLFTHEQLKQGAVLLHILGLVVVYVVFYLVLDNFLVPSLMVRFSKMLHRFSIMTLMTSFRFPEI